MKKSLKAFSPVVIAAIIAGIVIVAIAIFFVFIKTPEKNDNPESEETWTDEELKEYLNGQWIDCMPPLEGFEARLCERAEEIDYPYIAY